jgi:hypothetical protein
MNILLTEVPILTNGSGAFTVDTAVIQGVILHYAIVNVDLSAAPELDIVGKRTGIVVSNHDNIVLGTVYSPRMATHGVDGVAAVYIAAGQAVLDKIHVNEQLTVTLANGGSAKTGSLFIWSGK